MLYAKAFFDLQLTFAERVVALSGLPLEPALLDYTNLYIRLGLGRLFDPAHPIWQEYLAGLREAPDPREWTYRFYSRRGEAATGPSIVASFGCFSYGRLDGDRIRLHFRNAETEGHAPLAAERRAHRLAELAALFTHVRRTMPGPCRVIGASWLYNLDAYRRLFPAAYLASARAVGDRFRHMPLWGQFLDRHGEVKPSVSRAFLERLALQSSLDGLEGCFPFQVLSLEAPCTALYGFYDIEPAR
jgi:hypothetical protein